MTQLKSDRGEVWVDVQALDNRGRPVTAQMKAVYPTDLEGNLAAGGGGGGGGGDASAANQVIGNTALGAPADAEATGNGSILAVLKRLRTLFAGGLPASLGTKTAALSLAVTPSSDGVFQVAGAPLGAVADAEATGDGSIIAILKRLRTLFAGGLPASLGTKTAALSLAVTPSSDGIFNVGAGAVAIPIVPVVTTVAYSINDVVGGEIAFAGAVRASGGSGLLQSVLIGSKANLTGVTLKVFFFNSNPDSNPTDNNPISLTATDLVRYLGHVDISDWEMLGTNTCVGQAQGLAIPVRAVGGSTVYAIVVTRSEVTLAVGDITVIPTILQD